MRSRYEDEDDGHDQDEDEDEMMEDWISAGWRAGGRDRRERGSLRTAVAAATTAAEPAGEGGSEGLERFTASACDIHYGVLWLMVQSLQCTALSSSLSLDGSGFSADELRAFTLSTGYVACTRRTCLPASVLQQWHPVGPCAGRMVPPLTPCCSLHPSLNVTLLHPGWQRALSPPHRDSRYPEAALWHGRSHFLSSAATAAAVMRVRQKRRRKTFCMVVDDKDRPLRHLLWFSLIWPLHPSTSCTCASRLTDCYGSSSSKI